MSHLINHFIRESWVSRKCPIVSLLIFYSYTEHEKYFHFKIAFAKSLRNNFGKLAGIRPGA